MTGLKITEVDHRTWALTAVEFDDNNYEQSYAYAVEAAKQIGAVAKFLTIKSGGELLGAATVRIKKIPFVGGGIAFIPAGPLISLRGWSGAQKENAELVVQALVNKFVRDESNILRIRPAVRASTAVFDFAQVLQDMNFRRSSSAGENHTLMVDLNQSIEEIRQGLKQKWRGRLNASERNDLSIERGRGVEWIDRFKKLYDELRDRKRFQSDLELSFFRRVQSLARDDERFLITLVTKDSNEIAGHVASLRGDTAVYVLGATSTVGRDLRAGFFVNWRSMLDSKERGFSWYDVGGIDPKTNPGVSTFKAGMGGLETPALGTYEFAPGGIGPRLALLGESAYRLLKGL